MGRRPALWLVFLLVPAAACRTRPYDATDAAPVAGDLGAPAVDLASAAADLARSIDLAIGPQGFPLDCGDSSGLQAGAAWPMRGYCPTHIGRSPYLGPQTPTLKWKFATGKGNGGSPVVGADGTVYVGSGNRHFYALDGRSGTAKWAFSANWVVDTSSAAIGADGTIYFGSADGLYAVDSVTGVEKWQFPLANSPVIDVLIGPDRTVYIDSLWEFVYALDGNNGQQKWSFDARATSFPALLAGSLYVCREGGQAALDAATGLIRWTAPLSSGGACVPAVGVDGIVLFTGQADPHVWALDDQSGNEVWSFIAGNSFNAGPAIGADGTVYVGSTDEHVYALDGRSGRMKWAFATGGSIQCTPAIGADGTVYVGSDDNILYALDGATGKSKWTFAAGGPIGPSLALGADGTIYFSSTDKNVYAIGP